MLDGATYRMATAYAASLAAFAMDGLPRPFSASIAVTDRCNLGCSYCNFPNLADKELSSAQFELILDRLHGSGVRRIGLVGGEPMVRKDLLTLAEGVKRRGFYLTINSNLTLFGRVPDALALADVVFTSLDGDGTQASQEVERGAGSHTGVLEAIDVLIGRGQKVVAISVIRHPDTGAAERLLDLAARRGFTVHFQPQCVDAPMARGALPSTYVALEMRSFWQHLLGLRSRGLPVASTKEYLLAQASWPDLNRPTRRDPGKRCAAGRGFLFVDPAGRAWPCTFVRGVSSSVDLLTGDWAKDWDRATPCNQCSVGPMLEFNLLYQKPWVAAREVLDSYVNI
jgi:MoaA/NifB/PqqE/SkfB family radical SAM enzyme